jgi:hypothetical protein
VDELRLSETMLEKVGKQNQIGTPDYLSLKTFEPTRQIIRNISDLPRKPVQDSPFLPEDWMLGLVWVAVPFLLMTILRRLLNSYTE